MRRRHLLTLLITASVLQLGGCTQSTTGTMLEASLEPEQPAPEVRITPTPLAQNRQQPLPKPDHPEQQNHRPWLVIEQANASSAQNPDSHGYFNAIMTYDYTEGYLYQVYTAPLRLTDIQLQPGEKIVGTPAAGDTVRWVVGVGRSIKDGKEQQHIYVKPTKPGLQTTLIVTTDRRTYHIELHSYRETYMASVAWSYPHDDLREQISQIRSTTDPQVDISKLNFDYTVRVKNGRQPAWLPVKVFDDGTKTFIQFSRDMLVREAPALFVLGEEGSAQLVNYRMKNNYYIVDRLFDRAELRLGENNQNIVRIVRR
ncbi:P-type conjugative transfer protein TrbG (plasmid) [Prosthecochloris aestuarii DSM 271]|uniref:P-type conjugative transfer protein TrbG n=2 Tax=Prosthecochloris aestuarii TaxID=1102 RepID=B4S9L8_PROA2|nr:P-type conjugative transfer protein TrbG [Prosthecochloris aestuarii DSM 271]